MIVQSHCLNKNVIDVLVFDKNNEVGNLVPKMYYNTGCSKIWFITRTKPKKWHENAIKACFFKIFGVDTNNGED